MNFKFLRSKNLQFPKFFFRQYQNCSPVRSRLCGAPNPQPCLRRSLAEACSQGKGGDGGEPENLAAVLHGKNDVRLEKWPMPKFKDDEVLLAMDCVGICGTDIHVYQSGGVGNMTYQKPIVTGHESSAVVYKVGRKVHTLKPGDRVAVEPGLPCRKCDLCKSGRYNLCQSILFRSLPPVDGVLQKYVVHAPDFCFKLPDHVTMEDGALMEPLAVAVHGCRRAGVRLDSNVLVLGSGPIGFATVVTAKRMGATKILVTDINEKLLEIALNLGATSVLKVDPAEKPEEVAKKIQKTMGCQPNKTIDCCGFESALRTGVYATKPGGQFVLAGLGLTNACLPVLEAMVKQVDLLSAFLYCNDYPAALAMVSKPQEDLRQIITHHFDFKDVVDAFKCKAAGEGAIKVMIHVQPVGKNNKQQQAK